MCIYGEPDKDSNADRCCLSHKAELLERNWVLYYTVIY